jgi:penicillin-binding protein 2
VALDRLIDELSGVVEIGPRDRRRFKRLLEESKSIDSLPIRSKLSDEEVARFTAQRFRFPGVDIKARLFRNYPLGETGSHLLGYIGRINQAEKDVIDETEDAANYRGTEYIGKLGVEQSYEADLHGTTGFEEVETSAAGRPVRRLKSNPATPGNKVVLSVDIRLQALVEEMFGERRGALVALDPRSGEVLAFVSKPTFDPNLFVDGIDSESWKELNESVDKPLLNRALRGTYPPGSTFKPFMAIAALNAGKRSPSQVIFDGGTFQFGNHTFRSHGDTGLGPVDMVRSIVKSSNVYYYSLANEMGVDLMHDQLEPFGFGRKTGIDVEGEVTGLLPSTEWKRKAYKKPELQKWYAGETISLGIGQGYNNFTMLQMASATATLVSGGQRYKPRLVREIEDVVTRERRVLVNDALAPLPLKPEHVELINRALYGVTQEGTSVRSFTGAPYKSGGKTGTAQAVGIKANEKYNAAKMEEHKRDHSLYIAFAPVDAPSIALAIVVENSGFGSEAAAPITRRVFDYVLGGVLPSPEDMALTREGKSGAPVGKARAVRDVPLPGAAAMAPPGLPAAATAQQLARQAAPAAPTR